MTAQAEVQAQITLRQVASTAENFAQLHQVSGRGSYACIQSQTIALYSFQLKTDPMVRRAAFGTQNHGLAHQVFYDGLHLPVVEKIAHRHPATHLRDLNRISNHLAGVPESSVALIDKQQLRLQVFGGSVSPVDLRIDVSVDQKEIFPSAIRKVDKGIAPAHIALRAAGNPRRDRSIVEVHPDVTKAGIVTVECSILVIKMREQQ